MGVQKDVEEEMMVTKEPIKFKDSLNLKLLRVFYETNPKIKWLVVAITLLSPLLGLILSKTIGILIGLVLGVLSILLAPYAVMKIREFIKVPPNNSFNECIELSPMADSIKPQILKGCHILWVDERLLDGTEGIEEEFQMLGASITIVKNRSAAEHKIKERKPDLLISDIGRGEDPEAGIRMAELFFHEGLFKGPIVFYTGYKGDERIARADAVGAMVITEPEALKSEVRELLFLKKHYRRDERNP